MYAAAMGNAITAVFQCISAISVNGFLTLSLRRFLLVAFLPCGVVRFNLCGFRIVLADFLGGKINAVLILKNNI